jgi:hypothetical protein
MRKGTNLLYLCAIIMVSMIASASSLGSNNCFSVAEKRRRSLKSMEEKEVQLVSNKEADHVTKDLDEKVKAGSRRRSAPSKETESGWDRMISASLPKAAN